MSTTANSHKLNKDRAIGADAALISVHKMLEKLQIRYVDNTAKSIAISDAIIGVLNMRSAIATEYLKEYRRLGNGRN